MSLEKILRGTMVWIGALGAVALLAACETPLERAYGISQTEYRVLSIENPDAGLATAEAPRQDGLSTESALGKYRTIETETQAAEPPSVINVDIGG